MKKQPVGRKGTKQGRRKASVKPSPSIYTLDFTGDIEQVAIPWILHALNMAKKNVKTQRAHHT